jgi:hypothetical protein
MSARTRWPGIAVPVFLIVVGWLLAGAGARAWPAADRPSPAPSSESSPPPSAEPPGDPATASTAAGAPSPSDAPDRCEALVRDLAALAAVDDHGDRAGGPTPEDQGGPAGSGPGSTAPPVTVPAGLDGAARRWAEAVRSTAAGAPASDAALPGVDPADVAAVDDAVAAACGPGP